MGPLRESFNRTSETFGSAWNWNLSPRQPCALHCGMRIRLSVPQVLCSTLSFFLLAHEAGANAAEAGWVELFNGKDLSGWVQRGGKANYAVEDGVIVGSSVLGTDNSFLCTQKEYSDFILELDFKVDPKLNSGVQIRSECFEKAKTWDVDGKEIKIPAGRVHGYQVEIDMEPANKRWWTAGIYDESRRGWLYPGITGRGQEGVHGSRREAEQAGRVESSESRGARNLDPHLAERRTTGVNPRHPDAQGLHWLAGARRGQRQGKGKPEG